MPAPKTLRQLAVYAAGGLHLPNGRPLIIIGSPRSGTEVLTELLDSHPQIRGQKELLSSPRRLPLAYVNGEASLARARGYKTWSFKVIFQQLRWYESSYGSGADFLERLHRRGFTFLLIERQNRLLQALSYIHAEQTQYHFRRGEGAPFEKLEVDPVEVLSTIYLLEDNAAWGREAMRDIPTLELSYEVDLRTPETQADSVRRIVTMLGLEAHQPQTSLVRKAPRSVSERVANYEELAAVFSQTRYAHFLDE